MWIHVWLVRRIARAVIKDRVPISIVPRDQVPFSHLYMDVVGPLLNKAEYNFCLCLIDWPSVL